MLPGPTQTPASDDNYRQESFRKHFLRFWANVGDKVVFKRPKRNKQVWEVVYIEKDFKDVKWSNGGLTPNYIRLHSVVKDRSGKEADTFVWTCESKLQPYKGK